MSEFKARKLDSTDIDPEPGEPGYVEMLESMWRDNLNTRIKHGFLIPAGAHPLCECGECEDTTSFPRYLDMFISVQEPEDCKHVISLRDVCKELRLHFEVFAVTLEESLGTSPTLSVCMFNEWYDSVTDEEWGDITDDGTRKIATRLVGVLNGREHHALTS